MSDPIDPEAVKSAVRMLRNFGGAMPPQRYDEAADLLASLAEALAAEQAKSARVAELAHRFELVPRARLLGALTAKAKP